GPGLKAANDVQVVAPRGQHDDRDVAAAAQPPAYLEAVKSREHHVEHHDVRGGVAEVAQRRLAVLGGPHAVAEPAQSQLQALPGGQIVLDEQYGCHHQPLCPRYAPACPDYTAPVS